jgi:hypothetical protein
MLECPSCYRVFRANPEKLGARCPKCRAPLFERPPRRRAPEKDIGICAKHAQTPAVAKCVRCNRLMCAACRTRWHDEATCPECIEQSVASGEPTPHETQRHERQAWTGVVLASVGWLAATLVFWPLSYLHSPTGGMLPPGGWVFLGTVFFFASMIPALVGLGQSASALLLRGPLRTVATCGLVASGLQLGVSLGVIVLNLWHN